VLAAEAEAGKLSLAAAPRRSRAAAALDGLADLGRPLAPRLPPDAAVLARPPALGPRGGECVFVIVEIPEGGLELVVVVRAPDTPRWLARYELGEARAAAHLDRSLQ
jgi:hypothetical protein